MGLAYDSRRRFEFQDVAKRNVGSRAAMSMIAVLSIDPNGTALQRSLSMLDGQKGGREVVGLVGCFDFPKRSKMAESKIR